MTTHSVTRWADARALAASQGAPGPSERVPLAEADGRVLAHDVHARVNLPAFPTAAMDGWAVCGPGPWMIAGQVSAGDAPVGVMTGQALRIGTGAFVPEGADHVIPWEDAQVVGDHVHATIPTKRHIRAVGEERAEGELIAGRGLVVNPIMIGHLAAAGHDDVDVVIAPAVQVLVLGDEVVEEGIPAQGKVRDALGVQLPLWLRKLGARPTSVVRVPDDSDAVRQSLLSAHEEFVVTTGGTSRGHRDFVRQAWLDVGGEWIVDGVDVRPGHPMMMGARTHAKGTTTLVALPGNPLSALVALMTLAKPALDARLGRVDEWAYVRMAHPVRTDVTRVMVGSVETGDFVSVDRASSAMLAGAARSQGWAVVEPPGAEPGETVPWLAFPW